MLQSQFTAHLPRCCGSACCTSACYLLPTHRAFCFSARRRGFASCTALAFLYSAACANQSLPTLSSLTCATCAALAPQRRNADPGCSTGSYPLPNPRQPPARVAANHNPAASSPNLQLLESLKTQLFHQAGWRRRNSRRGTDFFQCRGQLCKSGEGSSSSTQCPAVWPDYSKARQGGDGTLQEGSAEKEVKAGRTESCHTFFLNIYYIS